MGTWYTNYEDPIIVLHIYKQFEKFGALLTYIEIRLFIVMHASEQFKFDDYYLMRQAKH